MDAKAISEKFVEFLRRDLTDAEWAEMKAKNATPDYWGCCASHDYVDSNMTMDEAFIATMGREMVLDADEDVDLINAAWDIARADALTDKEKDFFRGDQWTPEQIEAMTQKGAA